MDQKSQEPLAYLRHTIDVLSTLPCRYEPLLLKYGLDIAQLERDGLGVDTDNYNQFLSDALMLPGTEGLGLLDGKRINILDHGVLGYAMLASQTLGKAIERHSRFQDIIGAVFQTTLAIKHPKGELAVTKIKRPSLVNSDPKYRYHIESLFAQWQQLGQVIDRPNGWFSAIELNYAPPPYRDMYEETFQCDIIFNAPTTKIRFDSSLLELPLSFSNEPAALLCEQQCMVLLKSLNTKTQFTERLNRLFAQNPTKIPDIKEVSARLAVSERTLRRKLAAENTTFRDQLREFKMHVAHQCLVNTDMPMLEIAIMSGYQDVANFYRTYRAHFGTTPGKTRNQRQKHPL